MYCSFVGFHLDASGSSNIKDTSSMKSSKPLLSTYLVNSVILRHVTDVIQLN